MSEQVIRGEGKSVVWWVGVFATAVQQNSELGREEGNADGMLEEKKRKR